LFKIDGPYDASLSGSKGPATLAYSKPNPDPQRIASQIHSAGFAVLENYIDAAALKRAQDFVFSTVKKNSGNGVIYRGPKEEMAGIFIYDLPKKADFVKLCRDVYEAGTGCEAPQSDCYQVLRCLSGPLGRKNSMRFHFDSYMLAALVPIIIPSEGPSGDLLILPNVRGVRKFYAASLIDKFVLASPLKQNQLKNMYASNDYHLIRIKLVPGHLYFFWGYMSAHTNEECAIDKIRSTALFHYFDPHAASRLNNIMPTAKLKRLIRGNYT
jgi:hypothetical protein